MAFILKWKFSLFVEVSVGFKNTSVKFRENSESATLVLDVDGEFERPVSVQIATHDGTARGKTTLQVNYTCTHISIIYTHNILLKF